MERNKYEFIIECIEKLILTNKLKQGERLPSIRSLAAKYNCNKSTVIRAYKELESNHKIYAVPKSGYYLVEKSSLDDCERQVINFAETAPDPKLLPYKEFNHCINRAVELYKNNLFSYSDVQGLESLREALADHLSEYQIFTSKEKIFVTTGSQQALSILAKMPFPNGKKNVLIEQPTYSLIHKIVELNGDKLVGISRDYRGIDFHELEELFKNESIKFFYTIPRFHNPLGTSYSEKEKKKIVELAEKYDVYIVEDDYLADIDINKNNQPVFYYDVSERVIYVKSFSKAFMPGIRIGVVVLHDKLKNEFLKHKRYYDLNTSVLSQGGLEIFVNSGMYRNHVRKIKLEYKKKMSYLKKCLEVLDTSRVKLFIPTTGFFVWIKLIKKVNIDILLKELEKKDIFISPARKYFIENKSNENSFRICISKLKLKEIKSGIKIIFEEINRL
ncbi:PLP-dependent aminotransferase family protein [Clostridium thailandense]|uniref:aminotransferase-like domain-containing protein n=1 Tax=Clostridium thailandense TaxID=2794346 RepID=UPI00398A2A77